MKKTILSITLMLVLGILSLVPAFAAEVRSEELFTADEISEQNQIMDQNDMSLNLELARLVRRVACYARNARGVEFEAIGVNARATQEHALNNCYRYPSRVCHSLGCRVIHLRQGS